MDIGDTSSRGLHHLVSALLAKWGDDNSIDEAMAGFATAITVQINNDGSVTVVNFLSEWCEVDVASSTILSP